jgi:hypothetical protein
MDRRARNRLEWLASLTTRELVIYLLELQRACELQPELTPEVDDASGALRDELLRREWLVHANR